MDVTACTIMVLRERSSLPAFVKFSSSGKIARTGLLRKEQNGGPGVHRIVPGNNTIRRRVQGSKMRQPSSSRGTVRVDHPRRLRAGVLGIAVALVVVAVPADILRAQGRSAHAKTAETTAPKIDPAMQRAFSRARASLDQFLELARVPPPHLRGFALKVSIAEEPDLIEYIWVNDFEGSGDSFSGKINARPLVVKKVRRGRVHKFQRTDIVDWTYIDTETRTIHGNFTACAQLAHKPADLAAELREKFGLTCDI